MSQTFAERVKELGLPLDQIIIIGSGILDQLGIRRSTDIDVAAGQAVLEKIARSDGWAKKIDKNQRQYLVKHDGSAEIWDGWEIDGRIVEYDKLLDYAVEYDGVKFVNLDFLRCWKNWRGREKDMQDVRLIDEYLGRTDVAAVLEQCTPEINEYIANVFEEFQADLANVSFTDLSRWALEESKVYALGPGKRLRGALAMLMCAELSVDKEAAGYLAAAIELMHSYLLIIDDVMDKSPIRRGHPTAHEAYKATFSDLQPTQFESDFAAVNIGTLTQHVANWAIMKAERVADVPAGTVARVMHRYIAITNLGQLDDLAASVDRPSSTEQALEIYRKKSGYYSFVNPIACALALANRLDDKVLAQLEAFGLPAGVAFQLRDDWLGVFGDSKESGKANLDDIREGKNTFLVQATLANVKEEDRARLLSILGNEGTTQESLQVVRQMMISSGAVEASDAIIRDAAQAAIDAIDRATCFSRHFAEVMKRIIQYTMERRK